VFTIDDFIGDILADDLLLEITEIDSLTTCSGRVIGSMLVMERFSSHIYEAGHSATFVRARLVLRAGHSAPDFS
ncbi:2654_t:CDS:2, partial [Funneliformis mosseae]